MIYHPLRVFKLPAEKDFSSGRLTTKGFLSAISNSKQKAAARRRHTFIINTPGYACYFRRASHNRSLKRSGRANKPTILMLTVMMVRWFIVSA